ncbi:MAG TPA: CHAD domain-containing protein, partial [Planctomycetaceae bacterium]|nr:CHAD domain-containing protein [Planctomycetaceae bacterium]
MSELARAFLTRCFADLVREEPRAREGIDPEGVHQMRVAIRRLRTTFRILSSLFPAGKVTRLRSELAWLGTALGDVRDLDVYQCLIREQAGSLSGLDAESLQPYFDYLAKERGRARSRLNRVLDSRRHRELKNSLERLLADPGPGRLFADEPANEPAVEAATRIVLRTSRRLRKLGKKIDVDASDAALHRLRIRGKRLRYVLELFVPVLGKRIDRTLRSVRKLQDCLGDHHDACVADTKLRGFANQLPMRIDNTGLLLALGELVHVQQISQQRQRLLFFKLWKKISKQLKPSALKQAIGGDC